MRLPTPPELAHTPELASVAVVHAALEVVERALVAANPELVDQESHELVDSSPQLHLALALATVLHAAELRGLLELYAERAEQLHRHRTTDLDDIPF